MANTKADTFRKIEKNDILQVLQPLMGISQKGDQEMVSENNCVRMAKIASRIPMARNDSDILVDIGATIFWVPIYNKLLGYKNVTIICRAWGSFYEQYDNHGLFEGVNLRIVECDAEQSRYPLSDGSATCVVCLDLLEHLAGDPMNIFSEANRILKQGDTLILGTPNVSQFGSILRLISGYHPYNWSPFTVTYADRHNREYTPGELRDLFSNSGFEVSELTTFWYSPNESLNLIFRCVLSLTRLWYKRILPTRLLHCNLLVSGIKTGGVKDRYPSPLYEMNGEKEIHYPRMGLPQNIGFDKEGKTFILAKLGATEINPGHPITIGVSSVSSEPIDILADLFVSGVWITGSKKAGVVGTVESRIEIDVGRDVIGQNAYLSIKAVPNGKTWESSIVDIKLPYMRIS